MTAESQIEGFLDRDARLELLDSVGCGVWVYDGQDTRYVNRALSEITGFTKAELLTPSFFEKLIYAEDREMIVARGQARLRGEDVPEQYEIRITDRAGEIRTLAIHARLLVLDTGPVSVVSATDLTPLKEAQRTIRDGTVAVLTLLDSLPAHIIGTDPAGKPTYVNNHWLEFTGQSRAEAMATGTAKLIHPEDRKRAARAWSAAKKAEEAYEVDYRVRDRHGEFRWQNFRIWPVKSPAGVLQGWTSVSVDVQDAKELEEQLMLANQQLAEAVHAKDEVLGLISHELRTPLTTLLGNARFLRAHAEELDASARNGVAVDLENDARRLNAIIENMLVLSRASVGEHVEMEPILVRRLAESSINEFRVRVPSREVSLTAEGPLTFAMANPVHYQQILGNLLSNADKYSPAGLAIEVAIFAGPEWVSTAVGDHGPGIPEAEAAKVFDAFFRSPNQSARVHGVGLGLTVCQRLVELQGGAITVGNRAGGGCEFTFTVPVAAFEEE